MSKDAPPPTLALRVFALNNADELGYHAQQAVAAAVPPGEDYRIVGGHMVRLLLEVYPTPGPRRDQRWTPTQPSIAWR